MRVWSEWVRVWSEWVRVSGLHTRFGAVRGGGN